jgi:hypothetical protein
MADDNLGFYMSLMKMIKSKSFREKNRQLERVKLKMFQINERVFFAFQKNLCINSLIFTQNP